MAKQTKSAKVNVFSPKKKNKGKQKKHPNKKETVKAYRGQGR